MHIHALGLQSIWQAQFSRPSPVSATSAVGATPSVGAVSTIDTRQSIVAAINGGSLFHNLVSQLLQQQGLTVADIAEARTSDSFQNFLQALTQSLGAGRLSSTAASTVGTTGAPSSAANRFGQSGLEGNIRSLIGALGAGRNTTQADQLATAFKTLMNGLTAGSNGATSSPNASLSLRQVLQGMLQNVQQQGAPAELGQLVDTFA